MYSLQSLGTFCKFNHESATKSVHTAFVRYIAFCISAGVSVAVERYLAGPTNHSRPLHCSSCHTQSDDAALAGRSRALSSHDMRQFPEPINLPLNVTQTHKATDGGQTPQDKWVNSPTPPISTAPFFCPPCYHYPCRFSSI